MKFVCRPHALAKICPATTTTVSTVPWVTRPLPRLRTAVFFRLRLSLQNTADLLNPDSLTHPGTKTGDMCVAVQI